ncbi:MAG: hypothetical protein Tsb009_37390 [Planctomycetaceae bacterium]
MAQEHPQPESAPPTNTESHSTESVSDIPRRGFMTQFLAGAVGLVVGLVPFVTGLLFFFDPLKRKASGEHNRRPGGPIKDEEGYIKMDITTDALPADGSPQLFKIRDDIDDAWNRYLDVEIGSVWLRRDEDGKVHAFSSICPHLGCAVDYRKSKQDFYCPCHTSAFDLNGNKLNAIPPRGMDTLAMKQKNGNEIWIKYEKFRAALHEKKPIS